MPYLGFDALYYVVDIPLFFPGDDHGKQWKSVFLPDVQHFWDTVGAFLDRTRENYDAQQEPEGASESSTGAPSSTNGGGNSEGAASSKRSSSAYDVDTRTLYCTANTSDKRLVCRHPRDGIGASRVYKRVPQSDAKGSKEVEPAVATATEYDWTRDAAAEM